MLHKTRGIVFKFFKYRDTSVIVKIFTEAFGLQTYIVNGVRSKGARGKIALYQPLTLLDMVVYHKETTEINRISEVKCQRPFQTLTTDIRKTAIAMFMAEILYKSVKEQGEVRELFDFIHNSIEILDHLPSGYENFHLQFLLKLTQYLGFGVGTSDDFYNSFPEKDTEPVQLLLQNPYKQHVKIGNSSRRILLDHIIRFYQTHIDTLKDINSIKVLQEVL